jgi:heptosyltransferase-2
MNLAKELKDKNIDMAIVPSSVIFSGTNHFISHYSGARYKVGVKSKDFEKNETGYLLNIKNDFLWDSKKVHQIERNLDVIRQVNITPSESVIKLSLREENKKFAEEYFNEHFPDKSKPVIGFHPGAGKEPNVWAPEKFAELAYQLNRDYGAYIFISEGPQDEKYVSLLQKLLKEKYNVTAFAKHKGGLMNNLAIIGKTSVFVTNDTGVMHLASGLDLPLIALFGPTKAYEWGPVGYKKLSFQGKAGNVNAIDVNEIYETCIAFLSVKYVKIAEN